ncbi:MAG: hypothetical protein WCT49_04610 [Candidatus Paceibacterota bacterium]|jgi:ribulose-phosphate 3-epimerase|nr:hypothetical protein [Candidatus Paceibacterota bacterium]
MLEIIPAIMPKDFNDLKDKVGLVYRQSKTIHIDAMNGSMTHSINWPFTKEGLEELEKIKTGELALPFWKEVDFEVDVMMDNPEDSMAEWVNAGFHRVILHMENMKKFSAVIKEWKDVIELGLAVSVDTPNDEAYRYVDEGVDFLQFMGIYQIGFQGNPFDARAIEKVKAAREVYPNLPISVDGSVNLETAPQLIAAGANRLVIGSAIFNKKKEISSLGAFDISADAAFNVGNDLDVGNIYDKKDLSAEDAIKEFKKLGV